MSARSTAASVGADGVVMGKVWIAGLAAIAGSIVANLIALPMVRLLFSDVSPDFPPFQPGAIAFFTFIQVGLGVLVFWLLARFTRRPIRVFTIVALVALVLSCVPNVMLALNPAAAPFPGGSATGFLALIIFHFIAGAVAVIALTRLSRA